MRVGVMIKQFKLNILILVFFISDVLNLEEKSAFSMHRPNSSSSSSSNNNNKSKNNNKNTLT